MVAELPEGENPGILFQALFLRRLPADIKRRSALGRSFSPTYRRGLSQSFQARHLSPKKQLHSLAGNPTTLIWSDIRNTALKRAKRSLIKTTILVHADVNAKLSLAVDVSDSHVGEVMQQYQHGCWKPLAFSPENSPRRNNATQHSIENCLALFSSSGLFVYFYKGGHFLY